MIPNTFPRCKNVSIIFQFVWHFFYLHLHASIFSTKSSKTKNHFFSPFFISALQRGPWYGFDPRGTLQWLHLHQPSLLLAGRLRDPPPRKAGGRPVNNDNSSVNTGSSGRTNLLISGMDARKMGRPDHQRRRVDLPRREQLRHLPRQVPRGHRLEQRGVRLQRRLEVSPPSDDWLRITLFQLCPLSSPRLKCHGISIR